MTYDVCVSSIAPHDISARSILSIDLAACHPAKSYGSIGHLGSELCQASGADRLPDADHQARGESQVVLGQQRDPEHLLGPEQVAEVGAAEPGTGGAGTSLLDRPVIAKALGLGHVQPEARQPEMEGLAVP